MQPLAPQGYGTPNPYPHTAPAYGAGSAGPVEQVSEVTVQMLHQTRPWVLFLAVLMFLGSAFMVLGGLVMFGMGAVMSGAGQGFGMGFMGLFYIPLVALYVYPAKKLWGYGSAIGRLTASRQTTDLEAALGEQKSFWKFMGILTIVMFGLYVLVFIGLAVAGVAGAAMHH